LKRLVFLLAIILGCAAAAWAAPPATLTTLSQIRALSNGEGDKGYPAAFEATVTFYRGDERILFVQDNDAAIFVLYPADAKLVPGDLILIKGKTAGSFNPIVISNYIAVLHHDELPAAVPASFKQLVSGQFDCRLVSVRGVVRAADFAQKHDWMRKAVSEIQFQTESGPISVHLDIGDLNALGDLLDATVQITGVSAGKFDDKMQLTGTELFVPSLANIEILARPKVSPWSAPITSMDKILSAYDKEDRTPRIRVQGTITYYQPGHAIVLQDGSKSLWIETNASDPLRIGDRADAIGFTDAHGRFMSLIDAEILDSHVYEPVVPHPATWLQLAHWSSSTADGHQNDMVSIEGRVVAEVREATQDEFVLNADGGLLTAIYHHPSEIGDLLPMMKIPLGTRIRLTGICTRTETKSIIPGSEVPFNILLRSFDDIEVVAGPPLLNTRNLLLVLGVLVLVVLVVIARGWALERKLRRQTAEMAYIERRRSGILEDVNGSRPLTEIIAQITELVSFKLKGAPCWCQIASGANLGNCPKNLATLRVLRQEIPSRSGPPLGELFAAFDPLTKSREIEAESLSMATGLAALAIETQHLNSDLRRRSEFDLLTDIHNRFSLDKRLDAQIEDASQQASIFGLIYIDLDNFKRVNDVYGHRVGDLYLQEVAQRMKRQLRGHDTLARLGGDEFAVLVPIIRSRADVQEIAFRLERSFDAPFPVDGTVLHPAASVGIALYPEDAITKDGLLSTADAAMYVAKHTRHEA
jgi:diguanylate cyclase (GGDEF)-like protein